MTIKLPNKIMCLSIRYFKPVEFETSKGKIVKFQKFDYKMMQDDFYKGNLNEPFQRARYRCLKDSYFKRKANQNRIRLANIKPYQFKKGQNKRYSFKKSYESKMVIGKW